MKASTEKKLAKGQRGFSMPELIVVLLIIAILVVLALPQVISSRRAFSFSAIKRQVATTLNAARQEAMSQRSPITVRYSDADKKIVVYGGRFGAVGDAKNQTFQLAGSGLMAGDIIYGRPSGATTAALADTSNLTPPVAGVADITFEPDGSVVNAANHPQNNALFFYNRIYPGDMAFAISVLGAGGRVKIWRYNQNTNSYVE